MMMQYHCLLRDESMMSYLFESLLNGLSFEITLDMSDSWFGTL